MKAFAWTMISVTLFFARPACADTVFTDNTFNLADYSVSSFQSGGATISITQTATGGDPGSALSIFTSLPFPVAESYSGTSWFLNKGFVYDPASQGELQSINVSVDLFLLFTGQNPALVAFTPVIVQGGNYYSFHIPTTFTEGSYIAVAKDGLTAADFDLVTSMLDGSQNPAVHPDFSGGPLDFGFGSGLASSNVFKTVTRDARYDNLSFDLLSTTPEPKTAILVLVGLVMVALGVRRTGRRALRR